MPSIGTSKLVVSATSGVAAGSCTFNASGTFTVPVGVSKVSITGVGATGATGQPGNAGSAGGGGPGGGVGYNGSYVWRHCCYHAHGHFQGSHFQYGSPNAHSGSGASNPGAAGTSGSTGATGQASTGLTYNFAGGQGGSGGTGGSAGGVGSSGGSGTGHLTYGPGCGQPWPGSPGPRNPTSGLGGPGGSPGGQPGNSSSGEDGGNGGGPGGGTYSSWTGKGYAAQPGTRGGGGGAGRGHSYQIGAGGGGGGGSGGNGQPGGAGQAGKAASPSTHNCVAVQPGGSYPIVVGSPGGQVKISWNAQ